MVNRKDKQNQNKLASPYLMLKFVSSSQITRLATLPATASLLHAGRK